MLKQAAIAISMGLSALSFAQTAVPSAAEMVEQLKPAVATKPLVATRSLRNLVVEDAPKARPSLSLNIQFDFNSAHIRAESLSTLGNLASALSSPELASCKFAVEGHTDAKGSPEYNRKLSEQRANAVRDLLTSKGVDANQLVASGKGASEPANPADPLAPENRRVRIINLD
jgi:outer membrane protein OmpA-like peptidoglycan-associated protein